MLHSAVFVFKFSFRSTYNLIRRRCAGDVAFHLSSLPSHCILDWVAGDDGRTCSGQKTRGYVSVCERENERNNTLNTTNCKKEKKKKH